MTNVPRPRRPLEAALAGEVAEGAADRDQAAAVALGELALGGQPVAGAPFARLDGRAQVKIDLVVERDRARQEPEACHARRERPLAVGRGWGLAVGDVAANVISNLSSPREGVDGPQGRGRRRRQHVHARAGRGLRPPRRRAAHRRAGAARPRPGAARGRRRARRPDPATRGLARTADADRRPVGRPRRRGVHAHPAAGRRPGGAAGGRDAAAEVRPHRPGDDRARRVREGPAHGAAGPRDRRGVRATRRARVVDPRLHQPGGDRHPGAAGRRASRARAVQRGDRVPARAGPPLRGDARAGLARPRRPQPPVVDPGGAGRRRRPAAGAARGGRRGGDPRR